MRKTGRRLFTQRQSHAAFGGSARGLSRPEHAESGVSIGYRGGVRLIVERGRDFFLPFGKLP